MDPGVEERGFEAQVGQAVAVGLRLARDESMEAQAAQVVAHAPGGDEGWGDAEQLRKQWPQLAITKALGLK